MLDLVRDEIKCIDSVVLEPSCGTGNFLAPVLQHRLIDAESICKEDSERRRYALVSLMNIYGVELLADNAAECRSRLLSVFSEHLDLNESDELFHVASFVLSQNIVTGDALEMNFAELFGKDIQFDVILGNPPYQLNDNGFGTSAGPIYHHFVQQAKELNPRYVMMVVPSRWLAGGKGLDQFRESMLNDNRLRSIDDYLSVSEVFPSVGLKGGVCYFLWERDQPGDCRVNTYYGNWTPSIAVRPLLEKGIDVFIRLNEGVSILKKVVQTRTNRFIDLVGSVGSFGLDTTFRGGEKKADDDLKVYRNGGYGYVARLEIEKAQSAFDGWKIFVGAASPGTGNKDTYPHRVISTPFIGEPGSVSSKTYNYIGPFDSRDEAESVLSYLSCRLTRFLILLHKPSQQAGRKIYTFVPMQKWNKTWTDEELYAKYKISEEEIAFIEKVVRPMDLNKESRRCYGKDF